MFKRLGVGERLNVFDGLPVDGGAHREFGELPALGARYVGDWQRPGRHMARRGMAAQGLFDTPWIHLGGLFPTCLSRQAGAATLIESELP